MNRITPKIILCIHIAIIITLGLMVYVNSLNGKFVWDDNGLLKDNNYIKDWKYFPEIIKGDFGVGGGTKSSYYRPLQTILHMAGYSLWGLDVKGYHLTSILLHIFAAIALYFFIRLIFYDTNVSFLVSLLFLVHPINTEAVCYISGVSDPLSLLFILLCLIFYLKSLYSYSIIFHILALLSFSIALLSKENAVVVPALILLYHYTFKKKVKINKIIPFFAVVISYTVFRLAIVSPFAQLTISLADLLQRIPGFFAALTEYLRLLLLPLDLRFEYGNRLFNLGDPRVITGVSLAFVLIITAFFKKKNNPLFFFSVVWFFITLLPVSNMYPVNYSFMMEHWLYLPSLGFFLILSSTICSPLKNKNIIFLLRTFVIVLLIFYSYLTIKQNQYWREPIAFYKRTLKYAPDSWRLYNELGLACENASMNDEAIASFSKALEINPSLIGVYYNLGNLYMKLDRNKEAVSMYSKARLINTKIAQEYYEGGKAYSQAQKEKKASILYKKALELDQDNLGVYNDLASAYIIIGRYKEAISLLIKALELNPHLSVTHNNLAVAYYYTKQYSLAAGHCDKAIALGYKVSPELLGFLRPHRK